MLTIEKEFYVRSPAIAKGIMQELLLSNDTSDIEIDIVGICCDYNHAENAQEVFDQYETNIDPTEWEEMDDEEKLEVIQEYLNENTSVVCCEDGCIIWAAF